MTDLNDLAERLNRTVKIALDTGEAATPEEAERIFAGYKLQVVVGPDVADNAVLQAALLTAVNCASRTLLGGVTVVGASGSLQVRLPPFEGVASAVEGLGGQLRSEVDLRTPTLTIGDVRVDNLEKLAIRATFEGWAGGVAPAKAGRLAESGNCTPAGVLAGALGVSEIFQRLRGNPFACRRQMGLNLWRPERGWRDGEAGAVLDRLPSAIWLVGIGNLGQAYLWTLGLLPYGDEAASLVLQDFDVLAESNLSTSLLTTRDLLGQKKTRVIAAWAESRGFRTTLVERGFGPDFRVSDREPAVALIGVDNALARQGIESVGFERIIEAGLGKGPRDFLGIDLHTFPASKPAADVWSETEIGDVEIAQPAYRAILEATGDPCGTVKLAGRSVGAPFVGAVAGSMVVAELLRLASGHHRYEMISCHLRDLNPRTVVDGEEWPPTNIGSIAARCESLPAT
jgi:hypothetical protein